VKIFVKILDDTEEHIDWLENADRSGSEKVGIQNYQQTHDGRERVNYRPQWPFDAPSFSG